MQRHHINDTMDLPARHSAAVITQVQEVVASLEPHECGRA